MSPAVRFAWLAIGVLAGLALLLALPSRPPARPPAAAADARATPATVPADAAAPDPMPSAAAGSARAAIEHAAALQPLAAELLPAAQAGDRDAAYALAQVLAHCTAVRARGLAEGDDDARLATARAGTDAARYAELWARRADACRGFDDDPLEGYGTSARWLDAAADAGQPVAVLERLLAPTRAADGDDGTALAAAVRAALASGRSDALQLIGPLEHPYSDGVAARDAAARAVAWSLLACRRGYPCDPDADWRRELLAFRGGPQPEMDAEDALLFDLEPHQRELAREHAAELEALLGAGRFDEMMPAPLRDGTEP
jgi:hypothetical protein